MRFLVVIVAAMLLAACARPETGHWSRPGKNAASGKDRATCRGDANRRAEREFAQDTEWLDRAGASSGYSAERSLARISAERYRQRLYEDCLRAHGYEKTKGAPNVR